MLETQKKSYEILRPSYYGHIAFPNINYPQKEIPSENTSVFESVKNRFEILLHHFNIDNIPNWNNIQSFYSQINEAKHIGEDFYIMPGYN